MMHFHARKKLIKVAVLTALTLVFLLIVNVLVSSQISGAEEEYSKLNAQVIQLKSKVAEVANEQKARAESRKFYQTYIISDSAKPDNFTRDAARRNIGAMRKEFGLNSIQFSHSGFKETKNPLSTSKSIALSSYATVKFSSNYDMPVYDFIAALEDSLPGIVSISYVTVKRVAEPSPQALEKINAGQEINLVGGEVSFNWFGVVDPSKRSVDQADFSEEAQDHMQNLQNIFEAMSDVDEENAAPAPASKPSPAQPLAAQPKPAAPAASVINNKAGGANANQ